MQEGKAALMEEIKRGGRSRLSRKWIIAGLLFLLLLLFAASFLTPFSPLLLLTGGRHVPPGAQLTSAPAMFGGDPLHTRVLRGEQQLTTANVAHLKLAWHSPMTGGSIFSSPVVVAGRVYVGSFDGQLYAFDANGCQKTTCEPLWEMSTSDRIFSSPAVVNGLVYVGSFDGRLYVFNASGCGAEICAPLWTSSPLGAPIKSSPIVTNAIVYIGAENGQLYAFNAGGCGSKVCSPLWTTIPDSQHPSTTSPAAANGTVFIGTINLQNNQEAFYGIGSLYAFNEAGCSTATCTPLWKGVTLDGVGFFASPTVFNGIVYDAAYDGQFYAFNAAGCGRPTCGPLWSTPPTLAINESSPAYANGIVYNASWDHHIYAFNATGCHQSVCQPLWSTTAVGSIFESSPTIANGVIYIGSDDESLYAFNAAGCSRSSCPPLWKSPSLGDAVFSSPTVANDSLYVGSLDHRLYVFHLP